MIQDLATVGEIHTKGEAKIHSSADVDHVKAKEGSKVHVVDGTDRMYRKHRKPEAHRKRKVDKVNEIMLI